MCQTFTTCYSTLTILARYGQQLHNIYYYFIPVFSLAITDISLSPSSHLCLLYLSFTACQSPMATTQHCRSHQRPPLDAADHLSFLFCFRFFFSFFFFLFSVKFFLAMVWWVSSDGQIDGGWVLVVGYGSGWVEFHGLWVMAVGGFRWWWADQWWWVGRLVMGESVMANRWWCQSLFWYVFVFVFLFWWLWFGGGFSGNCGLILVVVIFFFFLGDCGRNNFSGCCSSSSSSSCCCCCCGGGWWWWWWWGRNLIYYFNVL